MNDTGTEGSIREAAKRETRAALIQAGMQEFFERGLDTPSLDAICARAGYTRGAFYVHFKDRDDFVAAVVDTVLGAFLDAIIATEAEGDDLEETVGRFAAALIDGNPLIGDRGAMRIHQLLDACARSEPIRRQLLVTLNEGIRRVEQAARAGQKAGAVRRDVAVTPLATVLVTLAIGLLQTFQLGLEVDFPTLRTTVLRLLRPAVATRRSK